MLDFDLKKHPILFFDAEIGNSNRSAAFSQDLIASLQQAGMKVLLVKNSEDALDSLRTHPEISCLIFDWDSLDVGKDDVKSKKFLSVVEKYNHQLPVFVLTEQHEVGESSYRSLLDVTGYFWKHSDTIDFIAGKIENACIEYLDDLLPPFFKTLIEYTKKYKYAWHTPGHMGGVAFLKSPVGRMFYDFYGENIFRSDLSISVPELGSLMEHSSVNGTAEKDAAEIFGADQTYFVTNGTSTANKMVVMSSVSAGDIILVDRNCHKSLQHAITMANAVPIYFVPTRNALGIIGGIPLSEFSSVSIQKKIDACPLIENKDQKVRLAVVTNSTYDGLMYNVGKLKDSLAESKIPAIHFDEAWFAYANFHPFYKNKYGMMSDHKPYHPTVYATQSTHKLLAAFSQASMVHIKDGSHPVDRDLFNETFMMHTSTSPQYNMIASLDVAAKMMSGEHGKHLMNEVLREATLFRAEFARLKKNSSVQRSDWFFDIWQPEKIAKLDAEKMHDGCVTADDSDWCLEPNAKWHGFEYKERDYLYLDPIKVTLVTPGIGADGVVQDFGIPAPIVAKYLMEHGVVDEKTGFYSMLFLFSIGVNESKAMTLLTQLVHFKEQFDKNVSVGEVFPDLVASYPEAYGDMQLQDLARKMHGCLKENKAKELLLDGFSKLPVQSITPNQAYQHIVRDTTETVFLDDVMDRVILTMVAPYPPGIPIIMPGEKVTQDTKVIIDYLRLLEHFDRLFPGFENEVHGVEVCYQDGVRKYALHCLP